MRPVDRATASFVPTQVSETTVLSVQGFATALVVFVNCAGLTALVNSVVSVYAIVGGIRALVATATVSNVTAELSIALKLAAEAYEITFAATEAITRPVQIAAMSYGREPASSSAGSSIFLDGGAADLGPTGEKATTTFAEIVMRQGTNREIRSGGRSFELTDAVTWVECARYAPPANSGGTLIVEVDATDFSGDGGGSTSGDRCWEQIQVSYTTAAGGAITLNNDTVVGAGPIALTPAGVQAVDGGVATDVSPFAGARARVAGGVIFVELQGKAAKDYRGNATVQGQEELA